VGEPQRRRGLPRLMLRFPSSRNALKTRYLSDAEFRSLCAAYEDAQEALKIREKAATASSPELADYRQLVIDIECDINALLLDCTRREPQLTATMLLAELVSGWRTLIKLFRC
jgi:hypothetical protein